MAVGLVQRHRPRSRAFISLKTVDPIALTSAVLSESGGTRRPPAVRIADRPTLGTQAGSAESLHLLGDASHTHFTGAACRVTGMDCPVWRPQPHGAWKRGSLALRMFFCVLVSSLLCKFNGLGTKCGWDAKGKWLWCIYVIGGEAVRSATRKLRRAVFLGVGRCGGGTEGPRRSLFYRFK